jgi:hypothetical protein
VPHPLADAQSALRTIKLHLKGGVNAHLAHMSRILNVSLLMHVATLAFTMMERIIVYRVVKTVLRATTLLGIAWSAIGDS